MPILSQDRFPRLWATFQKFVGGTRDKQRLALKQYCGQRKILEIGCSIGNVSAVFLDYPDVEFTGIDIDSGALELARSSFASERNFRFENKSLSDLAKEGKKFDYILFANILHHVDDSIAQNLLLEVRSLLAENAVLIIMEPEKARQDYNLFFRLFYLLEQGMHRRSRQELENLVRGAGFTIDSIQDELVSPDSMPLIRVGCITFISASLH